ncbi:MAG: hypothetical protein RIC16_14825 [Rhodospirillales bacterium]
MTELPYSVEVLTATLAAFNTTWWPVVAVGFASTLWLPFANSDRHARWMLFQAAGTAAVVGGPFWLGTMAALDFMAPVWGGLWLLQAAALLLIGWRGGLDFTGRGLRGASLVIVAVGALVYPILFQLETGAAGLGVPLAGSAPEPTAIVLIGLLLGARGRRMPAVLLIPALWAGVAAFNGYLLGLFTPWLVAVTLLAAVAARIAARQNEDDTVGEERS